LFWSLEETNQLRRAKPINIIQYMLIFF
jgi:hypothetical protein